MTSRTPRWISDAAIEAGTKAGCVDDHVVPLRCLATRLMAGADPSAMLAVADVTCRITRDEDRRIDRVRTRWPDLEQLLETADVDPHGLVSLGWERYRRGLITVQHVGHRGTGQPLLASEPHPDGRSP